MYTEYWHLNEKPFELTPDPRYVYFSREHEEALMRLFYDELRTLASAKMRHERPGNSLQATALVHEAWLRIVDDEGKAHFENRAHFFGAAARSNAPDTYRPCASSAGYHTRGWRRTLQRGRDRHRGINEE